MSDQDENKGQMKNSNTTEEQSQEELSILTNPEEQEVEFVDALALPVNLSCIHRLIPTHSQIQQLMDATNRSLPTHSQMQQILDATNRSLPTHSQMQQILDAVNRSLPTHSHIQQAMDAVSINNRKAFIDSIIGNFDKNLNKLFGNISLEKIIKSTQIQTYENYYIFMRKMGWVPSLFLTPFDELYHFLEENGLLKTDFENWTPTNQNIEDFDEFMKVSHNNDVLDEMLEEILDHPIFINNDNEKEIIKDIFEAHSNGKYNLSIPAFLPRFESFIAKSFNVTGILDGKNIKYYLSNIFHIDNQKSGPEIYNFLTETFYRAFKHGQPISPDLGRHVVLHGGTDNYGTYKNSLNSLILYFNVLLFSNFYVNGNVLHKFACIKNKDNNIKYFIYENIGISNIVYCSDCFQAPAPEV